MANRVLLPWPPKELSLNSSAKLRKKISAKKAYRYACWVEALSAKLRDTGVRPLPVKITFHPPDKRARDCDNMIGQFKRGQDGVATALCVDDKHFAPEYVFADPIRGGAIIFEVRS